METNISAGHVHSTLFTSRNSPQSMVVRVSSMSYHAVQFIKKCVKTGEAGILWGRIIGCKSTFTTKKEQHHHHVHRAISQSNVRYHSPMHCRCLGTNFPLNVMWSFLFFSVVAFQLPSHHDDSVILVSCIFLSICWCTIRDHPHPQPRDPIQNPSSLHLYKRRRVSRISDGSKTSRLHLMSMASSSSPARPTITQTWGDVEKQG